MKDLFLEEILAVTEWSQFGLFLLMFQLFLRGAEVENEILQGEDDTIQGQRDAAWGFVFPTQWVQTPEGSKGKKKGNK